METLSGHGGVNSVAEPTPDIPVIDVSPLVTGAQDLAPTAAAIDHACRTAGFFYAVGHRVDSVLIERLQRQARAFFARSLDEKLRVRMELGGRAWRGYFPLGGELTSGLPDRKEGLYFGSEIEQGDERALAPLHGANLFPDVPGLRSSVLEYLDALTELGHALAAGLSLGLGRERTFFDERYTAEPLTLLRLFHYPPAGEAAVTDGSFGVGEHTDYGLLTILLQDDVGGLQVKTPRGWIDAPPLPGSFVCNIGDMLDRATGGAYRSTPHRVRNLTSRSRLSIPFFFDPAMDARVEPIEAQPRVEDDAADRWDRTSVHLFEGTYGEYLLAKVARVFPALARTAEEEERARASRPPGPP